MDLMILLRVFIVLIKRGATGLLLLPLQLMVMLFSHYVKNIHTSASSACKIIVC